MKILLLADEESSYLYDHYQPGRLKEYDLMISCGDLKAKYLSFLVTMGRAPLLYVHGNHDGSYETNPPEGCDCIEDKIVTVNGLRILGLGGSMRYNRGPHQYSEREMQRRIRRLRFRLWRSGGVDLVVSHAPVRGYGDQDNYVHRGFEAFVELIEKYKPRYWIHGHVHKSYCAEMQRTVTCGSTTIINACGRYVLEIPEEKEAVL